VVCHAVKTLVAYLRSEHDVVCSCPPVLTPPFRLDGFVDQRSVFFRLDACRLCGGPRDVDAALQTLITDV
jgi:hypothetical protein